MGDECGEAIVVAVAQLLVGDGVVLVDDRDDAEGQESQDRLAGMEVLAPIDEVVWVEEHLSADESVARQCRVVDLHEVALADGCDCLQGRQIARSDPEIERADTGSDRPGGHHDHLVTRGSGERDLVAQRLHRRVADMARVVGQRGGSDLDDGAHQRSPRRERRRGEEVTMSSPWYSKLKSPIHTMSPSLTPARCSILGTPSRWSRSSI